MGRAHPGRPPKARPRARHMDLDHAAVVVADLARGSAAFARLGFALTPRGLHRGPLPPDGRIGAWGSGNHCAMLRQGYLEVLGVADPAGHKPHLERRLARYEGLHLIAFGTPDAAADAAALPGVQPPQDLSRAVPLAGGGEGIARFGIANLDAEAYPEADFILIEQRTPELLWQPALLDHPNGALALAGVTLL